MKKIAVIGIDDRACLYTSLIIKQMPDEVEVTCLCDPTAEKVGQIDNSLGLPILSLEMIKTMYLSWSIDAVFICTDPLMYTDITQYLNINGIREAYVIPHYFIRIYYNDKNALIADYLIDINVSMPCLHYYEFHITDHCNLNCKGCGHMSNISDEWFPDMESYKKDIQRLKKLFWGVQCIKLLGGEPLLNPLLPEFIIETRIAFPEADIYVGTNGLLIPQIDDPMIEALKWAHAWIMISPYPTTLKIADKIDKKCKDNSIEYCYNKVGVMDQFMKYIHTSKTFDVITSHKKCIERGGNFPCFTLREGCLYPCGPVLYTRVLNKKFGCRYEAFLGRDFFDIYVETNGWRLYEKLLAPIPFCAYCGDPVFFDWAHISPHDVKLEDYIVSENQR